MIRKLALPIVVAVLAIAPTTTSFAQGADGNCGLGDRLHSGSFTLFAANAAGAALHGQPGDVM